MSSDRPHHCPHCQSSYDRPCKLRKHLLKVHGIESPEYVRPVADIGTPEEALSLAQDSDVNNEFYWIRAEHVDADTYTNKRGARGTYRFFSGHYGTWTRGGTRVCELRSGKRKPRVAIPSAQIEPEAYIDQDDPYIVGRKVAERFPEFALTHIKVNPQTPSEFQMYSETYGQWSGYMRRCSALNYMPKALTRMATEHALHRRLGKYGHELIGEWDGSQGSVLTVKCLEHNTVNTLSAVKAATTTKTFGCVECAQDRHEYSKEKSTRIAHAARNIAEGTYEPIEGETAQVYVLSDTAECGTSWLKVGLTTLPLVRGGPRSRHSAKKLRPLMNGDVHRGSCVDRLVSNSWMLLGHAAVAEQLIHRELEAKYPRAFHENVQRGFGDECYLVTSPADRIAMFNTVRRTCAEVVAMDDQQLQQAAASIFDQSGDNT